MERTTTPTLSALMLAAVMVGAASPSGGDHGGHGLEPASERPEMTIEVMHEPRVCRHRPVPGDTVVVDYKGMFSSGSVFDSSKKHKSGFQFTLGEGSVIRCWEEGLLGMCNGEKRRLVCPPEYAYGMLGSPPVIPPGATLTFEIELKRFIPGPTKLQRLGRCLPMPPV
jgi:FK506-binding protein 2